MLHEVPGDVGVSLTEGGREGGREGEGLGSGKERGKERGKEGRCCEEEVGGIWGKGV
jgi:hypothetical protein